MASHYFIGLFRTETANSPPPRMLNSYQSHFLVRELGLGTRLVRVKCYHQSQHWCERGLAWRRRLMLKKLLLVYVNCSDWRIACVVYTIMWTPTRYKFLLSCLITLLRYTDSRQSQTLLLCKVCVSWEINESAMCYKARAEHKLCAVL